MGNWSGKQRRDERQGKLNPFKKAALERIGFSFNPRQQGWEELREKLKEYVSKKGKLRAHNHKEEKDAGIYRQLQYYQKMPKRILGVYVDSNTKDAEGKSVRREHGGDAFTQERIDVLTEAGLDWMLSAEQVNRLKEEKGLVFPMPGPEEDARLEREGDLAGLEKHAWLTSFEGLVAFTQRHGHTYATEFNSSEELGHWASEMRKKMNQLKKGGGKAIKDKAFNDYQAEMLIGIDFLYLKPDIEWMENYERLAGKRLQPGIFICTEYILTAWHTAFRRLFGTVAVTDKFCCFETLHQVRSAMQSLDTALA